MAPARGARPGGGRIAQRISATAARASGEHATKGNRQCPAVHALALNRTRSGSGAERTAREGSDGFGAAVSSKLEHRTDRTRTSAVIGSDAPALVAGAAAFAEPVVAARYR